MPLLLASWNVAGWETTLRYIREHYGSLEAYLDRHQIDIRQQGHNSLPKRNTKKLYSS